MSVNMGTSVKQNTIDTSGSNLTPKAAASAGDITQEAVESIQLDSQKNTDKVNLSRLAVSLSKDEESESAPVLSREELAKKGRYILTHIKRTTESEARIADNEIPKSDDPDRLARAKQATSYIYKQGPNPFANLSRDQLTAIIYDDSGAYTTNERVAAGGEQQSQDTKYWQPIFAKAEATGDYRESFEAGIAFFDRLSPIEQSYRPADYKLKMFSLLEQEEAKHGGALKNGPLDAFTRQALDAQKNKEEKRITGEHEVDESSKKQSISWSEALDALAIQVNGSATAGE